MTQHRWSGWPGAICLDCGVEDPKESCLATNAEGAGCTCADQGETQQPCKAKAVICTANIDQRFEDLVAQG